MATFPIPSALRLEYTLLGGWAKNPIIEQLRATGVTMTDEEVALISPLAYAHVIPNGTYFFDRGGEEEASAQSISS